MRNLRVHTRLADLMRDLDGYLPAGGAPPGLSPSDAAVAVNCLHRLRERRPDLPVILATGFVDEFTENLVTSLPQVLILKKPYSLREIRKALDTVAGVRV